MYIAGEVQKSICPNCMHCLDHSEKSHGASTEINPRLHHSTLLGSTSSEESDGERKVCIVCTLAVQGTFACTPYFLLSSFLSPISLPFTTLYYSSLSVPLLPPPALPSSWPSFPSLSQEAIDAAMSTLNSVLELERPERCVDRWNR